MTTRSIAFFTIAAVLSAGAFAQETGRTRADVRKETAAAIRSGDVAAPGESGLTQRERHPSAYAAPRDKAARKAKTAKPGEHGAATPEKPSGKAP